MSNNDIPVIGNIIRGLLMNKLWFLCVVLILGITGIQASQQYDDLAKLVKSGVSEDVIISYIDASDSSYNLSSDQIVQLRGYGASPHVIITAMKHKGRVVTNSSVQAAPAQPVPVETSSVARPSSSPPYVVYRVPPPWRPWRPARGYWYSDKTKQAIQLDVSALFLGTLSLNYEYLFNRQHGIVVEGSYYPGYIDGDSHGENLELAYRWHWAKSMNSGFLGVFVNGGRSYGNIRDWFGDTGVGYTQTSITIGPDIGKRWVAPWGLSLVARIGYGYTWSKFDNPVPDQTTIDRLRWLSGLDTEISLGYAF